MTNPADPIIVETPGVKAQKPEFAIIWLHGLGANGHDFEPIVPELGLDQHSIRFVFPHAPNRPVTINNGYVMPAWYDIKGMDLSDKEDRPGMQESEIYLNSLIEQQTASGIPASNIIIAGFSQGGAVATYSLLRSKHQLAGCMALSTYVPFMSHTSDEMNAANTNTPIFWGHGIADDVVPILLGQQSVDHLRQIGYTVQWQTYNMQHSVNAQEIADISTWIESILTSKKK